MNPVYLPMQDFPLSDVRLPQVLSALPRGGVPLPVQRTGTMPTGKCYWNVEEKVNARGGHRQDGWMLEWLPGVYVHAMHHAVWVSPEGEMRDVTQPQEHRTAHGITTFVPDSGELIDLKWSVGIPHRFCKLVDDSDLDIAVAAYLENSIEANKLYDWMKSSGLYTWSPRFGWSGPSIPKHIGAPYEAKQKASFRRLHHARASLLKKYGS